MKYVVDSGSTKSTWKRIEGGCTISIAGLNPLTTTKEERAAILNIVKMRLLQDGPVDAVFFYGAGCGSEKGRQIVKESIQDAFGDIYFEAEGDMMGSCRALYGNKAGYAGILGTGSNACHYDGSKIDRKICSMGYLLGDEGSGNHIGRLLTKDFLSGKMADGCAELFGEYYCKDKTKEEFVAELYKDEMVNVFFGSLTYFANHLKQTSYVHDLLLRSFSEFFENQVAPIMTPDLPRTISLTGSVAWLFQDTVSEAAEKAGITVEDIIKDPIDGMAEFHGADSKIS